MYLMDIASIHDYLADGCKAEFSKKTALAGNGSIRDARPEPVEGQSLRRTNAGCKPALLCAARLHH
jgi:hypothetical protein